MSMFCKTTWYTRDGYAELPAFQDGHLAEIRAKAEGWTNRETVYFVMCVDSVKEELDKMRHAIAEGAVLPSLFIASPNVDWVQIQDYYRKRFHQVKERTEDALKRIHANNMEMTIYSVLVWTRGYCSDADVKDYMHERYGWPLEPDANSVMYQLKQDGKLLFTGTENDCYIKLQKVQGQSANWAMKHNGYSIEPFAIEQK